MCEQLVLPVSKCLVQTEVIWNAAPVYSWLGRAWLQMENMASTASCNSGHQCKSIHQTSLCKFVLCQQLLFTSEPLKAVLYLKIILEVTGHFNSHSVKVTLLPKTAVFKVFFPVLHSSMNAYLALSCYEVKITDSRQYNVALNCWIYKSGKHYCPEPGFNKSLFSVWTYTTSHNQRILSQTEDFLIKKYVHVES